MPFFSIFFISFITREVSLFPLEPLLLIVSAGLWGSEQTVVWMDGVWDQDGVVFSRCCCLRDVVCSSERAEVSSEGKFTGPSGSCENSGFVIFILSHLTSVSLFFSCVSLVCVSFLASIFLSVLLFLPIWFLMLQQFSLCVISFLHPSLCWAEEKKPPSQLWDLCWCCAVWASEVAQNRIKQQNGFNSDNWKTLIFQR